MTSISSKDPKNLVLLELNELNFELVKSYCSKYKLKNFERIINLGVKETSSEDTYEKLEPWIQWVSAHSGKIAEDHGVFRLGDCVNSSVEMLSDTLGKNGVSHGFISPMNMPNNTEAASFFLPDPWTKTAVTGDKILKRLSDVINVVVNQNASGKVGFKELVVLVQGLLFYGSFKYSIDYLFLAIRSLKKNWLRAVFLDVFLTDVFFSLYNKNKPRCGILFLNAGAHIQHHYYFNSEFYEGECKNPDWYILKKYDPIRDMLFAYNDILGRFLETDEFNLIIATGLTQKPYDRLKFYWRLRDHGDFLDALGIDYASVAPRMTRDFLITFDNSEQLGKAHSILAKVIAEKGNVKIFGEIEVRSDSLFVTLTYPDDIREDFRVFSGDKFIMFRKFVDFVALKNGMHDQKGYLVEKGLQKSLQFNSGEHISQLYMHIRRYFGLRVDNETQ